MRPVRYSALLTLLLALPLVGCSAIPPAVRRRSEEVGWYFENRGRDFVDIFRGSGVGCGFGLELTLHATEFVKGALGYSGVYMTSLRKCTFYYAPPNSGIKGEPINRSCVKESIEFTYGMPISQILGIPVLINNILNPSSGESRINAGELIRAMGVLTVVTEFRGSMEEERDFSRQEIEGSVLFVGDGVLRPFFEDEPPLYDTLINKFDLEVSATALVPAVRVHLSPGQTLDFLLGFVGIDIGGDDGGDKGGEQGGCPPTEA